jgi:DamX protein
MLDNDNLTYSYQRRTVGNNADRALITLERSQKLDLLLHLLANLQQSLIVCGPEGIGKTTLLAAVGQNRKDMWEVVLLSASANSSFESLVNDLLRGLNIAKASAFDLSALRDKCAKQKVVLLIDDAGNLVPGLITMLMEFADSLPGLRLVFAMNHDQFHIKSGTDKLLEECHFIELPPLSKKQCGEYLQNLSAQPGAIVSYNAITDSLIDDLYRDTNGIPGKILGQLPKLANYQSQKRSRMGLWLAIAGVLAGAGYAVKSLLPLQPSIEPAAVDLSIAKQTDSKLITESLPIQTTPEATAPSTATTKEIASAQPPAPALPEPKAVEPEPARTNAPIPVALVPEKPAPANPVANDTAKQSTGQPLTGEKTGTPVDASPAPAKPEPPPEKPVPAADSPPAVEPPVQTAAKPVERKPAKPAFEGSDQDWIMAQPPGNFTLQVMVLSNKDAALRFQKKYADYRDGLKFYPINKGEQEKYVVIYGSFQTAAEATQLKAVMPGEFKQAMEKRFRAVQKESRR